jgi:hypothetical protein
MKEALSSSETSVLTRATRRNIPEDTILHSHRREDLKSYMRTNYLVGDRRGPGRRVRMTVAPAPLNRLPRECGSFDVSQPCGLPRPATEIVLPYFYQSHIHPYWYQSHTHRESRKASHSATFPNKTSAGRGLERCASFKENTTDTES